MKFVRSIIFSLFFLLLVVGGVLLFLPHLHDAKASGPTTWYIRADGGTRYSAYLPTGQCDGQGDAPYPGTGVDQHCAYNDLRYLWADGSYTNGSSAPGWGWVISGGDTVIIRNGPWRVGYSGPSTNDYFLAIAGNPYASPPSVPSGTASDPTRILGENYANCTTGNMTQVFAGYGAGDAITLSNSQNVDIQCLELTDHAQCTRVGAPSYPNGCSTGNPIDDYAANGIYTNASTSNILLQDLNIHGFTSDGIRGAVGGLITVKNVRIGYNASAGWDFDDGVGDPSVNGQINASHLTVEWSGCNEEYPITHANPAISCYDQDSAGYGDGVGTPNTPLNFTCDHCLFRYNTQDGLDLLHVSGSDIVVTNSESYGNMGQQYKLGAMQSVIFYNNLDLDDCARMSLPMAGTPSTYNQYLGLFCRAAGDNFALNLKPGGNLDFENNTVVGGGATTFDMGCGGSDCSTSTITFKNNVVLGYVDKGYNADQAPGGFYWESGISPANFTDRSNNIIYGLRSSACPSSYPNELCVDPQFVNEPSAINAETDWDNFNFTPSAGSPLIGAGLYNPANTTDYNGTTRSNPPTIGAIEVAGSGGGSTPPPADTTSPTTSITSPANNATVSGTTSISATASDNVGVTKVELYLDQALKATDTSSPYNFSLDTTALTNGIHSLWVKAYDAAGNIGTSASVSITVANTVSDTSVPSVPTNLTLSGITASSITLGWSASTDNVGVTGYNVYRNGTKIATTNGTAYTDSGLSASTKYAYTVSASDAAGNTSVQSGSVSGATLANAGTPSGPAGYTFCAVENATCSFSGTMSVAYGAGTSFTYLTLTNGTLCANSIFTDPDSGVTKACFTKVVNIGDTTPPTASITSPSSDATVSGTLSVTATANDNVGVVSVSLYLDNALKATDASSPYAFSLDTTSLSAGTHTLTVKAYDAAGNIGASGSVSVTVRNTPSVVTGGGGGSTYTPPPVTTPTFAITSVTVSDITNTSANVTVSTHAPASIQVKYGPTTAFNQSTGISSPLTTAYMKLTDLLPNTVYDFVVLATPPGGTTITSQTYILTTTGGTPSIVGTTTGNATTTPPPTTPTTTVPSFPQNVAYGDTGSEVLFLQQTLKALGFFPASVTPSTYFGTITEHALLLFQNAHNLNKSGFLDTQSQALLEKVVANTPTPGTGASTGTTNGGTAPATTTGSLTRNLSYGSTGTDVTALQHLLAQDGDYAANIFSAFFGSLTQAGVQAFQAKHGIISYGSPATTGYGAVGPKTRGVLNGL